MSKSADSGTSASPPQWAENLLYWFSNDRQVEFLAGDLSELYRQRIKEKGAFRARASYIIDVLDMVRPFNILKNQKSITTIDMYKNYLKIAIRNMLRSKAYSVINVLGLAIGMAATIIILLFVQNEMSYDKYHENSDRIYRVSRAWLNEDGEESLHLGQVAPPFGPLLKSDFDGIIEQSARIMSMSFLVKAGDKAIEEDNIYFADAEVFKVFSWNVLEGDLSTALDLPNSIVITESTAKKYFAEKSPIGETMSLGTQFLPQPIEVKVTAVIEDIPENTHFHADFFAPMAPVEAFYGGRENFMSNYGSNNFATYLLLKEGYPYQQLQDSLGSFIDKHFGLNSSGELPSVNNKLKLWPLTSIHLNSHLDSELEANGDIAYVYLYTIVALFILIIACINFINLATARSAKRAREVGMRKVMGAYRSMLIKQFITESLVFAILSLVIAVLMVYSVLPWFNDFSQKQLSLNFIDNQFLVLIVLGITIITGFIAGSYPAFYLSAFKPVDTLKGEMISGNAKFNLRSALVVFQFALSIVLLIGVGVVNDQLEYVKSKDLGFDDHRVLVLPTSQKIINEYESVKTTLLQHAGISKVALASRIPSGRLLDSQGAAAEVDDEMKQLTFRIADIHTDHDYFKTLDAPIIAGRDFDRDLASDSLEAFVLNESSVRTIGWKSNDEAVGKKFNYGGRQGYVIGVVKDFHFESLHQEIAPMVFLITSGRSRRILVKLEDDKVDETMSYLQEQWAFMRPGYPFSSFFIDARFDEQYANEDRLAQLVTYFSGFAVIIGMLGLFGLASFTAEQRFKEIGIRKVLGASIGEILMLLTKGFTVLVFIGFIIAVPISYFLMNKWLATFAYHGSVSWVTIIIAGMIAILLAWITVGFQTFKAARSNPIDSIQYE
jgi:putative ABC transport system permease protein